MAISHLQQVELECPTCGRPFTVDTWLIIDAAERPDLAQQVREGSIHDISCPNCGQVGTVPAPLLYHDPQRRQVLFAVPPQMEEEEWHAEVQALLWMLIGALPEERRLPYLSQIQAEAGITGLVHVLQQEPVPEQAVDALGDALMAEEGQVPILAEAMLALLDAQTPARVQQVLETYPFLLDQAMDAALEDLAAAARSQSEPETAEAFERARIILQQLRGVLAQPHSEESPPAVPEQQPPSVQPETHDTPSAPPPAQWGELLAALLNPEQEATLEELQAHYPALSEPLAVLWLQQEIERRRAIGNLGEVQLLEEWRRQIEQSN